MAAVLDEEVVEPRLAPVRTAVRPGSVKFMIPFIAAMLAVVIGAELLVRFSQSRLAEPVDYYSKPAQLMVDDMNVLRANRIRSDLVFVGTSMVRRDIDANRLEVNGSGRVRLAKVKWANNVALPGAQTPVVERWLLGEVVPRLQPKRVVWGISSLDFNSGRRDHTIDVYDTARATDRSVYGGLDRGMERIAISKYRTQLRDPYALAQALGNPPHQVGTRRPLSERGTWVLGYKKLAPKQLTRMRQTHAAYVRDVQLRNFTIGEAELAAYRDTLTALRRRNIDVAIVIMPVTKGYLGFHPRGATDFLRWKRVVTGIARADRIPVIDLSNAIESEDWRFFRDYEHLAPAAARSFTDLLAGKLRRLGW